MRVVYRMRGLLGDATEEFVETLSQTNAEAVDDEQVYRMANVLADCGEYLYLYHISNGRHTTPSQRKREFSCSVPISMESRELIDERAGTA